MNTEEILEKILAQYVREYRASEKIKAINRKIRKGIYRYSEAEMLAQESGEILARAFRKYLPEALTDGYLYRETAEVVLKSPLLQSSRDVRAAAIGIQKGINEQAGIGMIPIEPEINMDQIDGILSGICGTKGYAAGEDVLMDQVGNFLEGYVDDFVRENADFQYQSGLEPKVIRTAAGKCCKWCSNLAGVYKYEDVRDKGNDVWKRHRNCHCVIEYDPGQKSRNKNARNLSTDRGRNDRIKLSEKVNEAESRPPEQKILESEMRAQAGQNRNTLSQVIRDNPKVLANYTPETMKAALESAGLTVEPLSNGGLKGIPYESGGGYKATFGGDGVLMYHPEKGSHHEGAYWKISGGGKEKSERYDMDGNKKK